MWSDFKPAIRFVSIFLVTYLIGNFLYGVYIGSCGNNPDIFTKAIANQSTFALTVFGADVSHAPQLSSPSISILKTGKIVLNIFEGCNGINVMIVFVAFILSFGGNKKRMLWFVPIGLLAIHLVNIGRILLLYWVAIDFPSYFYYVHKYLFTAIIYLFVFLLWVGWVKFFRLDPRQT